MDKETKEFIEEKFNAIIIATNKNTEAVKQIDNRLDSVEKRLFVIEKNIGSLTNAVNIVNNKIDIIIKLNSLRESSTI
jgi:hypothetical protein